MTHDNLLVFGRRIHNAFRTLLNIGGDGSKNWTANQADIEHHLSGVYLLGVLAHLEGSFGKQCWNAPGDGYDDFLGFVASHPKKHVREKGITPVRLDALICVRNAYTHNDNDLSENDDKKSLDKVNAADLPGLKLKGTKFVLDNSFSDFVRLCLVVVAQYHGVRGF